MADNVLIISYFSNNSEYSNQKFKVNYLTSCFLPFVTTYLSSVPWNIGQFTFQVNNWYDIIAQSVSLAIVTET